MVDKISNFKLTKENAKEYFFLNECRMSWMDWNGFEKADLFRSYNFDKELLDFWTNEWLDKRIEKLELKNDLDSFYILHLIEDFCMRINKDNYLKLLNFYNIHKFEIKKEIRIDMLYRSDYSEVLSKLYEYGLLYSAHILNLTKIKEELFGEFIMLNNELKKYDSKYIKKLKKRIDM